MAIKLVKSNINISKFINTKDMRNSEVGITEGGDKIICFRSATEIFGYLITDISNNYTKFYNKCNAKVTLLPRNESVTLKFYNSGEEEGD